MKITKKAGAKKKTAHKLALKKKKTWVASLLTEVWYYFYPIGIFDFQQCAIISRVLLTVKIDIIIWYLCSVEYFIELLVSSTL